MAPTDNRSDTASAEAMAVTKAALRAAEKLGYRPNLAARFLSSSKRITIGVVIPREVAYFYDEVREGIFEAATVFEPAGAPA